jgi:LPS-assembly lipoprotein
MKSLLSGLCLLLLLAGCGYHPLYATGTDTAGVADVLSSITIEEADTRPGQLVRNNLLSSMRPAGTASADLYKLVLKPKVTQSVLVNNDEPETERRRLLLAVSYQLIELKSGTEVNSGKAFSNVSYDVVREPISDLQAEANATNRAAQEVGQDIRIRLAAFIAGS